MRYLLLPVLVTLAVIASGFQIANPYLFAGSLGPFDQEFYSILVNGHDMRGNAYVPKGTPVSTSAVLLVGEDTPDNAHCQGCTPWNQQNGLTISMRQKNTITPMVGLSILTNPGIDGFNGVWGFNVNLSNAFHSNTAGAGLFDGELNIGLDDYATDIPDPGHLGQSLGLAITESSMNQTGKRVSAAYGIGSAGHQNFHHGLWAAASPTAQSAMDDLIHASGPITTVLDLSQVQTGPEAIIMPPKGGLALGQVENPSELPLGTRPGTEYWCMHCARNTEPCGFGTQQTRATSLGTRYRCD